MSDIAVIGGGAWGTGIAIVLGRKGTHRVRLSMGRDPASPIEFIHRPFESQSPLHRINLINEIRNLTFDQPGEYSILIEIDDDPLLATSLTVSN